MNTDIPGTPKTHSNSPSSPIIHEKRCLRPIGRACHRSCSSNTTIWRKGKESLRTEMRSYCCNAGLWYSGMAHRETLLVMGWYRECTQLIVYCYPLWWWWSNLMKISPYIIVVRHHATSQQLVAMMSVRSVYSPWIDLRNTGHKASTYR
jgi:hypothetical protein